MTQLRVGVSPYLVQSRPRFGTNYLFHAMALSPGVLWIELEANDGPIAIGNRLSYAMQRSTGTNLFGLGMPYHYALGYLVGLQDEFGPITLVVSNAQGHAWFIEHVIRLARMSDGALMIIANGHEDEGPWSQLLQSDDVRVLYESDLAVRPDEVPSLLHGVDVPEHIARELSMKGTEEGLAYEEVLATINLATGHRPPPRPSPHGVVSSQRSPLTKNQQLEVLIQEERWIDAFELATVRDDKTALHILTESADAYFARGEPGRLLPHVRKLVSQNPEHANAMYWLFQAYVALGRLNEVERRVERFLKRHQAPTLAASYASVARPPNAVTMAVQAVDRLRVPETLASLGFLWAHNGEAARGISLLREAFEGYRQSHRYHRAIQLANSIGSCYVSLGDHRRALYWGRWGMAELYRRGIREELLRLSCTNLVAYASLLVGELQEGQELLRWVKITPSDDSLPPTLEGLVTTIGDYNVVEGNAETALFWYRRIYAQYFDRLPGYATQLAVRGLLHAGRLDEAKVCLNVALEAVAPPDSTQQARLNVVRTVIEASYPEGAFPEERALLEHESVQEDAVLRAEYLIARSSIQYRSGNLAGAEATLSAHRDVFGSLGRSGWVLLGPPGAPIDTLRSLIGIARPAERHLLVLNDRSLLKEGHPERLSRRYAELLTLLLLNPEGLTGEALLLELYGDAGSLSSLKAIVSRCRKVVGIDSAPYRLAEQLTSDLTDIEAHLRAGRLREALELYKGPLLPESEAPGIQRARERIDEALRQAALHANEGELVLRLARKWPDDLELWERAAELFPKSDPTYPLVRARVRRIRGEWGL
ncbi:MAG: hypothetical protein U5K81_12190 [Trueperaceae bacterium]|nr:hypothetical protein [Trueperaceae bacterium]